jgi:hypothetical protein
MSSAKKVQYRVRNWADYNKSLIQRGSLTVWIDEEILANWHPAPPPQRSRGGQVRYSDQAIECLLMLKAVFRLPYRQVTGFAQSIMALLDVEIAIPDYTLLCKRAANLRIALAATLPDEAQHIVMDSTGLKVYGEGEWKVRQHGASKRRTWRKLHLSVNADTHEIQAVEVTEAGVDDAAAGLLLLDETPGEIDQVSADGAYDKRKFYEACTRRKVQHIGVPPRRDAKIWQHGNCRQKPLPRDQNLRLIRRHGRKKWKRLTNYHQRSLAETAVFRFKVIFGNTLQARRVPNQITEARIKIAALNRMTRLGMPDSYPLT